jgi:purine-nucleoside phosphorylase
LSSDAFYSADGDSIGKWRGMGVLAVEMESAALYMTAARLGRRALAILTVSDIVSTGESTTAAQRQSSFRDMISLALESTEQSPRDAAPWPTQTLPRDFASFKVR